MTHIPFTRNASISGSSIQRQSPRDVQMYDRTQSAWMKSSANIIEKLEAWPRFVTKRSIARFMVKQQLFEQVLDVHGSIVECGVFHGAGLFTWANLSSILEPVNHTRKIFGFDTFAGFPASVDDCIDGASVKGDLHGSSREELLESVARYDMDRPLSHVRKIELIQGDFLETGKAFLSQNRHALISLLYLDFDLFAPTHEALKLFIPRMPKGAIIAFDELNCPNYPGETVAALMADDILKRHRLQRSPIDPWISYIVL